MTYRSISEFLDYYRRIRHRTMQFAELIPPDRMEWSPPDSGAFSCGDTLRHVAGLERYMFVENVLGRPSRYPGHTSDLASGPSAVMQYVARLHSESLDLLSTLSDADLLLSCETPAGASLPRWKWLRAMIEHEVHHRGQMALLLRLIGTPVRPMFGLTSEEVLARSATPEND